MGISIDDVYGGNWLKASDLEHGPVLVTISEIGQTSFKDKRTGTDKKQITLKFHEQEKQFGCNITNARQIAKILNSRNTDDWIGKQIVLYVTEVESFGEMVEAIRVRARKQQAAPQQRQPIYVPEESEDPGAGIDDDSDIPFNREDV